MQGNCTKSDETNNVKQTQHLLSCLTSPMLTKASRSALQALWIVPAEDATATDITKQKACVTLTHIQCLINPFQNIR